MLAASATRGHTNQSTFGARSSERERRERARNGGGGCERSRGGRRGGKRAVAYIAVALTKPCDCIGQAQRTGLDTGGYVAS